MRAVALPLAGLFFAVLALAAIMTGITLLHDAHVCGEHGGTYSVEGTTGWCRY